MNFAARWYWFVRVVSLPPFFDDKDFEKNQGWTGLGFMGGDSACLVYPKFDEFIQNFKQSEK